jgi:hypothetical protein
MQRIPDSYYTKKILDGTTQYNSPKQESPKFFQGADIELSFYLNVEGQPVTLSKYDVYAVVKKSIYANTVLWQGDTFVNVGLREEQKDSGFFSILIPRSVNANWLPGTFYMDVVVEEKAGTVDRAEKQLVVMQTDFQLLLSTTSPNPKMGGQSVQAQLISIDHDRTRTYQVSGVEQTLPKQLPIP